MSAKKDEKHDFRQDMFSLIEETVELAEEHSETKQLNRLLSMSDILKAEIKKRIYLLEQNGGNK